MAYTVPAGSIIEIRLRASFYSQVVINTFHYRSTQTYTDGETAALNIATDFNAVVWSAITPALSGAVSQVKIDAQWVFPTRFRTRTINADPEQGSSGAATSQTGTACVVKRLGEQANRANQGRVYLYGVGTIFQSEGRWTNDFLTGAGQDLPDAVKAVIQSEAEVPLIPVIWSAAAGGIGVPIVSSATNPIIRYQRRREIGVGQ